MQTQSFASRIRPLGKSSVWLFAVVVIFLSDSLLAQNPLRAQATQQHYAPPISSAPQSRSVHQTSHLATPQRDEATRTASSAIERIERGSFNEHSSPLVPQGSTQRSVEPMAFNVPVRRDLKPEIQATLQQAIPSQPAPEVAVAQGDQLNFIERESKSVSNPDSPKPQQQNFGQLISKLGMNLAFVLFLAIGGVLVAKHWVKPQAVRRNTTQGSESNSPSMEVLETLRVDAKTTLHLVSCGVSKVLVATDSVGLKSVNLLSPTFDRALLDQSQSFVDSARSEPERPTPRRSDRLKAYEPPEKEYDSYESKKENSDGMDEKLIRMLLENSKKHKAAR